MKKANGRMSRMIRFGKSNPKKNFLTNYLCFDIKEVAYCFQKAYGRPMIIDDLKLLDEIL